MGTSERVTVPRLWPGYTFVCIGGGPSLTVEDVEVVKQAAMTDQVKVVAVNDAYRLAPWADVLYGFDWQWWEHHNGCPEFRGLKYTCGTATQPEWNVTRLELGQE